MNDSMFGQWLRVQRRIAKLSQRRVEELAGLGEKYVTHLESGKIPRPMDDTRAKLHSVFGTSDEDLVNEGILERVGSGKDAIYLWPDRAKPTPPRVKSGDEISVTQAMAILRPEAESVVWTESLARGIAQPERAVSFRSAYTRLGLPRYGSDWSGATARVVRKGKRTAVIH